MKIAVITDIHHGPASHTKKDGWDGLPVLERFVSWAEENGADLLLDLGDHISDTNHTNDQLAMREVAAILEGFPGPRVHILGNHDVKNLSIADNEDIFGCAMTSRVVDLGEARLIAWQPSVRPTYLMGLDANSDDLDWLFLPTGDHLDWLVAALLEDERPAIIASHVPLSGHAHIGNYYFEHNPRYSTYPDHDRVRAAVEETGRAAAWISGHVHWNTITNVRGVQHITVQSMSERFTTMPEPAGAYAMLEIVDGTLSFTVHGEDPFHACLPFRASGVRPWLTPLQPFRRVNDKRVESESA